MSWISQQTEWLSMIEVSGPFLAVSVLEKMFPQGLDAIEALRRKRTRSAYDEWCDAIDENDPRWEEYHREWIRLVLTEILEFDDSVLLPCNIDDDSELLYKSPDSTKTFAPDLVLSSGTNEKPHLLVSIQPPGTDLEKVKLGDGWPASIVERMILLCRTAGVRLGMVTNGERWMLVNAPVGSTSSHASWYARIWFQETVTLKAFQSLLGVRRWFGPEDETLPAMLEESLQHHEEVTDTLGEQVRRAVEVLVQCLDKADQDRNRELLQDVPAAELYEAGLTVMMRLVFVLCAEERGLFLLGDPTYDQHYAITTLRGQLTEEADRHGPEVLERRHDAWARLLAVFRAVYGGIEQETLRMPALGGSLFDPDRFPFLEGRSKGTNWKNEPAKAVPIDNRTVLLLLNALQILEQRGGALLLSYKALDVEQIGHVYEGLLEHTVERLPKMTLGLIGSKKAKNPNLALDEMESAFLNGEKAFADLVQESTLRSTTAIKNALKKDVDDETFGKVITVCGGDMELANRIHPFTNLLRADAWGDFIVYRTNSFAVSLGADRRETGTHYTAKSLTESIVEKTLEPLAYDGPAEGKPREGWKLKSSIELLDLKICDPAMGSGAFLVQVCRWLAERLVEAWGNEETASRFVTIDGMVLDNSEGAEPMPNSLDDRLVIARRLVAEKCLYGVDMNPLAVELAKLSIWLVTIAKNRPFGFLDHNLRLGDSLLGIHRLDQLTKFALKLETKKSRSLFASNIQADISEAINIRKKLRETPIRDIQDVYHMERLNKRAKKKLENVQHIADAMIGEALKSRGNAKALESGLDTLSTWASAFIQGNSEYGMKIMSQARKSLSVELPEGKLPRKPFHWILEFPEVFERGGFDGIVGNPPFIKGHFISRHLGNAYREAIVFMNVNESAGLADLVAFFFARASILLSKFGKFGLLSTNSIADGDTNRVGLDYPATKEIMIYRAERDLSWPGKAGVVVSIVWATKGKWRGSFFLDNQEVSGISPQLTEGTRDIYYPLLRNKSLAFNGSYLLGEGYIVSEDIAQTWFAVDEGYHDIILPYINGKELFSYPDECPRRWAISFWDWPEEKASKSFETAYQHLLKEVKPIRDRVKRYRRRKFWWIHAENNPGLYHALGFGFQFKKHPANWNDKYNAPKYVICKAKTSNTWAFTMMPSMMIFDQSIVVITSESFSLFAQLQSTIHEEWAIRRGSSLKHDMSYTASTVFETYPFSETKLKLEEIGRKYLLCRKSLMTTLKLGLTKIYNHFHNPDQSLEKIQEQRDLHVEMDKAVAHSYGWDDLDLEHGFHETKRGVRFTISEGARREVLQRLLKLNHKFYEEEVRQGFHNKNKKKTKSKTTHSKKKTKTKDMTQGKLFLDK
jgi:Eco57I restriction-modification methylase